MGCFKFRLWVADFGKDLPGSVTLGVGGWDRKVDILEGEEFGEGFGTLINVNIAKNLKNSPNISEDMENSSLEYTISFLSM